MAPIKFEEFPKYLKDHKSIPRYNASEESKSTHLFWSLEKTTITKSLKAISDQVIDVLKGIPENDRELLHVQKTAKHLSTIKRSKPVKVALLGAQGAGKSLLINALFGLDGLSLTGADGAACTSSIIKYAHYRGEANMDGAAKFWAEV